MKRFHITVPETVVVMQNLTVDAEDEEEAKEKLENYSDNFSDIEWWNSESEEVIERHTEEMEVTRVQDIDYHSGLNQQA